MGDSGRTKGLAKSTVTSFSFPTRVVFGSGAVSQLPELLAEYGAKRVLLVTDQGLVHAGLVERVLKLVSGSSEVTCFDRVEPNPTESCLEEAVTLLRRESCDLVVGLGGGSVLDTAKAACMRLNHPGPLNQYEIQVEGYRRVTGEVPANIAIPTTAGTGSEVGRSAVITLETDNRKAVLLSPKILPTVALCDPELTLSLPAGLTASTGMDALTHNLEAYLSTEFHPICDAIALGGIRLVGRHLVDAVKGGGIEARSGMMLASSMGAIAFQKDLGVAHALAHPLSTLSGVPHGLANAIVLPHAMAFNKPVSADRLRDVACALGCAVDGLNELDGAELAIRKVEGLLEQTDLPNRLSAVGVEEDLLPELAAQAIADPNHRTNPRPCTCEDMVRLYRAAL